MSKIASLQLEGFEWTNINYPTATALKKLSKRYGFHHLSIDDCLSPNQRAKIDEYDDYLFIILHFPYEVKIGEEYEIHIDKVDIFIRQDLFITVHNGSRRINDIFQQCKKDPETQQKLMGKGPGYFLYMLLNRLFLDTFPILDKLSRRADRYEEEIFDRKGTEDMLEDILQIKKEILEFRRIILPERPVIAQLEHKNSKLITEDLEVYFDDVVDKVERIWNTLESLKDMVDSIQQTNETIISHNTSNIMKILTLFSVVILPLTFLTGVYGMNLNTLPYADNPYSFIIVGGMMLFVAFCMFVFFKIKHWL